VGLRRRTKKGKKEGPWPSSETFPGEKENGLEARKNLVLVHEKGSTSWEGKGHLLKDVINAFLDLQEEKNRPQREGGLFTSF